MRRYQTAGQLQGGGGYLDAEPIPHPRHVEFRGFSADTSSSSADRPRDISISPEEEAVQGGMDDGSSVGDGKDVLRRSITSMEFHKNMINTRSCEWSCSPEQNCRHDTLTLPHFPKTSFRCGQVTQAGCLGQLHNLVYFLRAVRPPSVRGGLGVSPRKRRVPRRVVGLHVLRGVYIRIHAADTKPGCRADGVSVLSTNLKSQ